MARQTNGQSPGERHSLSELMLFYKWTPFLAVPSCSTGNGRLQTRYSDQLDVTPVGKVSHVRVSVV